MASLGFARVKFGYMAQNADGLSIEEGDRIEILQMDSTGWWKGTCLTDKQSGWFPAAYVEMEVCNNHYFGSCALRDLTQ